MDCPSVPGVSRRTCHIDSMPMPLVRAKSSRAWASATVNTSVRTSLTPSIGVTPIWLQLKVFERAVYSAETWA